MTRILGLDIGTVRIGVALSDPLGMIAQPLMVINRKKANPVEEIVGLIDEYSVERIVVGLPLQLDGAEGLAAQAARAFVRELEKEVSVPIDMWDERMSTAQAQKLMIGAGTRRKQRRENIDKVAASLILQSYLDANSNGL